jgi:hypothetical protein
VDRVRLTAGWSLIAPNPDSPRRPDFNAADPAAYPAANWVYLDRAVRLANEFGLKVMIDIAFWAPRWATHDDPATPNRLRTEIDPEQYALFASAVARRYNGSFTPPLDPGPPPPPPPDSTLLDQVFGGVLGSPPPPPAPSATNLPLRLPAVSMYTLWNEHHLEVFLLPQWQRRGSEWFPRSAEIYRAMVQAAYPAVKSQAPNAQAHRRYRRYRVARSRRGKRASAAVHPRPGVRRRAASADNDGKLCGLPPGSGRRLGASSVFDQDAPEPRRE